jgi:hypothetical protein
LEFLASHPLIQVCIPEEDIVQNFIEVSCHLGCAQALYNIHIFNEIAIIRQKQQTLQTGIKCK